MLAFLSHLPIPCIRGVCGAPDQLPPTVPDFKLESVRIDVRSLHEEGVVVAIVVGRERRWNEQVEHALDFNLAVDHIDTSIGVGDLQLHRVDASFRHGELEGRILLVAVAQRVEGVERPKPLHHVGVGVPVEVDLSVWGTGRLRSREVPHFRNRVHVDVRFLHLGVFASSGLRRHGQRDVVEARLLEGLDRVGLSGVGSIAKRPKAGGDERRVRLVGEQERSRSTRFRRVGREHNGHWAFQHHFRTRGCRRRFAIVVHGHAVRSRARRRGPDRLLVLVQGVSFEGPRVRVSAS